MSLYLLNMRPHLRRLRMSLTRPADGNDLLWRNRTRRTLCFALAIALYLPINMWFEPRMATILSVFWTVIWVIEILILVVRNR